MAEGPDAPQREDDPRDTRIKQQDREISRLRVDLAQVGVDPIPWTPILLARRRSPQC